MLNFVNQYSGAMVLTILKTTRTRWRLTKWTLVAVWKLLTTACTMVEGCVAKELVATSAYQALIYNGSAEPHCAWVIRGADKGDVVGMRVTDWITPSGFSCTRDRLTVRDGAHPTSPFLRILCGSMCGIFNDDTEVVTSTNFMRIVYTPFDFSSLHHRGFTLVYRGFTIHPVKRTTAMYTGVNYVLMCASVVVIGGLTTGLLYLFLREIGLLRRKKRQDMIDKLKKRRPAFSGQSGLRGRLGRGQSTEVNISSPNGTATSRHPFTTTPDTPKTVEEIISTPVDESLSHRGTVDGVIYSHSQSHQDENHAQDVSKETSFPQDMTYVHCNGKTNSSGSPVKNHLPGEASPQLHLTDVVSH